jgi:hypothetical protein
MAEARPLPLSDLRLEQVFSTLNLEKMLSEAY